jgi:DNA-directed RNA polymerase subunit beta'
MQPQIRICSDAKFEETVAAYPVPERAMIQIADGDKVSPGDLLAKSPREASGTQDITGGLPRVTEIFEVRKPKNPAVIAEVDGSVEFGDKKRGKAIINIVTEAGEVHEHVIPSGKHFRVTKGDQVVHGQPLTDGDKVPKDILRVEGSEEVQRYLIEEVQGVYLSQNVTINDKHIETIVSQMMRNVMIKEAGDSDLLPDTVIDRHRFRRIIEGMIEEGMMPPTAEPMLQGITKAAVQSDSFISAASFQETTKVLTEAALSGKKDRLVGLKENVIMGHMIPAGTGYRSYFDKGVRHLGEPPMPKKPELETVLIGDPPKSDAVSEKLGEDSSAVDPLREFLMGNSSEAGNTSIAPETHSESTPEVEKLEPHPDLLIGGEPSVEESPPTESSNSEDETDSEG